MLHLLSVLLILALIRSTVLANNSSRIVSILRQAGLSSGAQIFLPSDPNYLQETEQRFTIHDEPTYVVSVKPASFLDVQTLVKVCAANEIPFLATGGGHGYTTTYGRLRNGVEIDLSNFRNVSVDAHSSTMTIGGGVKFGDILEPLGNVGKEIPVGASACPGVIGATIGGGVSRYNGLHGMILDSLRSVQLVISSGDIVTASERENPDLFWAIRGAGTNFGIILSALYEIYDLTSATVTNADFIFPRNASSILIDWLKSYEQVIPAELVPMMLFNYNEALYAGTYFSVNVVYIGTRDKAQPFIQPLLDANPLVSNITEISWKDITYTAFFGAGGPEGAPCVKRQNVNIYGASLKTYDPAIFERIFNNMDHFFLQYPDARNTSFTIEPFPNAAVKAVPRDATAYPHRDVTAHMHFTYIYNDVPLEDEINRFARDQRSLMQSGSGFHDFQVYVNYAHGDEGPVPPYTKRNLPRLRRLKDQWDPQDLFAFGVQFV